MQLRLQAQMAAVVIVYSCSGFLSGRVKQYSGTNLYLNSPLPLPERKVAAVLVGVCPVAVYGQSWQCDILR